MNAIINLFIEEHAELNSMFKNLAMEKDVFNRESRVKDIIRTLSEHFHEEELFYSKYNEDMKEIVLTLERLKSEHGLMIDLMKQKDPNIEDFIKFLIVHERIEEKTIYPELERTITEKDMHELVEKFLNSH